MDTIFFPIHLENNPYCDIVIAALKKEGILVENLKDTLKRPGKFLKIEIINLNFYEDLKAEWPFYKAILKTIEKYAFIILCKITHKKIIYTMHNRITHSIRYRYLNKILRRKLVNSSDLIISLCKEGVNILEKEYGNKISKKTVIIEHPSYPEITDPKDEVFNRNIRAELGSEGCMLCSFLGSLSAYKNIELIIQMANELHNYNIKFLIAGFENKSGYAERLKKQIQYDNVVLRAEYIPENELEALTKISDILLYPYNTESSLNSGSLIHAFSMGKTCVVPEIGTVKDLRRKDAVFCYTYKNSLDHYSELKKTVLRAYDVYNEEPEALQRMGNIMKDEMKKYHSHETIGKKYLEVYMKVLE